MHVLVCLDDSDPAWAALEHAASSHPDSDITLLHVINPADTQYGEYAQVGAERLIEEREDRAERLFEEARETLGNHDGRVDTMTAVGIPARTIVETAEAEGVDHIVLGSHGRSGVTRILLGSVAETVARRSPVPVTVVR